jgi:putative FmdB family regulatory protein
MPIYEYQCRKCEKTWESYYGLTHDNLTETCKSCGAVGDRIYSVSHPKVFEVFTTRNILPEGEPITVRGQGQLRQLEAEHGVKMIDGGAPPKTRFNEPA